MESDILKHDNDRKKSPLKSVRRDCNRPEHKANLTLCSLTCVLMATDLPPNGVVCFIV